MVSRLMQKPVAGFPKGAWKIPMCRPLFLLPEGEGQDEGKERATSSSHHRICPELFALPTPQRLTLEQFKLKCGRDDEGGVLPHPSPLPLGEGVTRPVFRPDESGQLLDKPTNFKQPASGCFPRPAGEGSRVREKKT